MKTAKELAALLKGMVAERLEARRWGKRLPLEVGVWSCGTVQGLEAARRAAYEAAPMGWRWGPVWSNAWFRLRVPRRGGGGVGGMSGDDARRVEGMSLRFSSGTEATVWSAPGRKGGGGEGGGVGGVEGDAAVPVHGLDVNHTVVSAAALGRAWSRGEYGGLELYVEAACNRPLGATTFFWDDAVEVERWKEEKPGRLEFAELVTIDREWEELVYRLRFLAGMIGMENAGVDPAAVERVIGELAAASEGADAKVACGACAERLAELLGMERGCRAGDSTPGLRGGEGSAGRSVCRAIGHAHIDTAWLWTLGETRRKCLRTFSSALRLMEEKGEFRFLCTQPQQYAWVERDSPGLFEEIRKRVREGRWEVGCGVTASGASGAMWIEPDCNMPSGESLIRQFIVGTRYVRERFGATASHPYVFLPDTFGFPGSMPQILAGCGVKTFIFNKLWWNESNAPTMSAFRWCGIDGTEVVSYLTPGMEYNATMTAPELRKGDVNHREKDATGVSEWLQPFGFGDGGGGPTEEMVEAAGLAARCEGLPRVEFTRVDEFCERLHERREALRRQGEDLSVWPEAELYLERHRGTYTTQAWIKRANRRGEEELRLVELLVAGGRRETAADVRAVVDPKLEEAWKILLLNQFHDILPGSSIKAVYDEARVQFRSLEQIADECKKAVAGPVADGGKKAGAGGKKATAGLNVNVVMNPCSSARSGVVSTGRGLVYVEEVPGIGVRGMGALGRVGALGEVVAADGRAMVAPVSFSRPSRDVYRLANGVVECDVCSDGTIRSLRRVGDPEGIVFEGPLNVLTMYEDTPKYWEAWDIERDYEEHEVDVDSPDWFEVVLNDPLRVSIMVSRTLGMKNRITQWVTLDAGSPRVDVQTHVDWHGFRRLVRVEFPTGIRADEGKATYDIQFGHVRRSVSRDDPLGAARFEVCAHRWMDLSGELVKSGAGSGKKGGDAGPSSSVVGRAGLAILNDGKYGHSCHGGTMGLTLLRSTKFPDETADMGEHEFTYSLMPHGGDWRAANVDVEAEALNRPLEVMEVGAKGTWAVGDGAAGEGGTSGAWAFVTVETRGADGSWGAARGVEVAAVKMAEDGDGVVVRLVERRGVATTVRLKWGRAGMRPERVDLLERRMGTEGLRHLPEEGVTEVEMRAFEIVTLRVGGTGKGRRDEGTEARRGIETERRGDGVGRGGVG